MSANPNNTPEQKAQWLASRNLGSWRGRIIAAPDYKPERKEPSRRDRRRMFGRKAAYER